MSGVEANAGCAPVSCPACGSEIVPAAACATGCASGGCALLACLSCGLSVPHPRRAPLAYRLARWWHRLQAPAQSGASAGTHRDSKAGSMPLPQLKTGLSARIQSIATGQDAMASRLAALGLVPGARILLRQRRPAVVLELDGALLALDAELATAIHVSLD